MNITSITPFSGVKITTDEDEFNEYIRYGHDCWYASMGESEEPVYHCEKLEALYQWHLTTLSSGKVPQEKNDKNRVVNLSLYSHDGRDHYCLFEHHEDGRIGIIAERIPDITTAKAMELAVSSLELPLCNHESKKLGQHERCIKCGMHIEDGKIKQTGSNNLINDK